MGARHDSLSARRPLRLDSNRGRLWSLPVAALVWPQRTRPAAATVLQRLGSGAMRNKPVPIAFLRAALSDKAAAAVATLERIAT